MLLFREVYGWLRYLIVKDPLCQSQGIVVEEIYSTFAPFSDANDGVRTLVIHKIQDGMTPRIELRAIGLHPQIFWYPSGASEGSLVAVTNQFGFSGDYKSWDCSDLCQWLLAFTLDKLCKGDCDESKEDGVTINITPVTAKKTLDYPVVKRIIDAVIRASQKGTRLTKEMINKWLKENESADLMDFALSVMHWFDQGKLHWKEIEYLENEYAPGKDIIDWSWLKRQLNTPDRLGKLPPPIGDRVLGSLSLIPADTIKNRLDNMLYRFTKGKSASSTISTDTVRFGNSIIAHFKDGSLPYQYLQQVELCDPHETILPWSFIRRNILSYAGNKVQSAEATESLIDLILSWLKESHLLLLLYKGDPKQEEALSKALAAQLEHHIGQTLGNESWMKSLLASLSSGSVVEMKRALQVEFDLWLLDALSPAIKQWKLPLSPHAFSIEQKDQDNYNKMYKIWEKEVKGYLKTYRSESGNRLTDAISHFYAQAVSLWKTDELKDYKAKIPSASKILNAIEKGNLEDLLNVLCEDFEHEVGSEMPSEIKTKLLSSPYFNAISREVKIQSMLD
jgi:hypothetical protein